MSKIDEIIQKAKELKTLMEEYGGGELDRTNGYYNLDDYAKEEELMLYIALGKYITIIE